MSSVISHFSPNLKTLIPSPLHHSNLVPSSPHLRSTSLSYRRIPADRQLPAAAPLVAPAAAASQKRRKGITTDRNERIIMPGCDFNHWLVVMEFPNDPSPTREEMIETYLSTLSTVLGSIEEAMKNMYAFSTTTYTGFQCIVSEELTEKFKGLPGVLWVLPDSYLHVKNKDYGGDKFINGEISPCTYPTYQPNQSNGSKSESTRYERQEDNPPALRRTHQDTALPESTS